MGNNSEDGQAIIEFALLLPSLHMPIMGGAPPVTLRRGSIMRYMQ